MRWTLMLLLTGAMVLMTVLGCEKLPPTASDGSDSPPAIELGSLVMIMAQTEAEQGTEYIGDTFITNGITSWGKAQIDSSGYVVTTYAGSWYNEMVVRDGQPLFGSYQFAGETPHNLWLDENQGVFASHMILIDDDGLAWIWQWPSNLGSLVDLNIEVLNRSTASELGLVGTATCFSTYPAAMTHSDGVYSATMRTLPGDLKLALVDLGDGHELGDSVTVRVNGVELIHWVGDFIHHRHPEVTRYFRFNVSRSSSVTPLGDENRRTYGHVISATNPHIEPTERVYLEGAGFTDGEQFRMIYQGSQTWSISGLSSWVGLQDLRVITEDNASIFRTVRLNGIELHHLASILLDPDPPIELFRITLNHDGTLEQGSDNRTVDIDVGDS
ncbi:MAG: hypothetical protein V1853_03500 [bacterium]